MKLATAGTSDITGCTKDGRFVAFEAKIHPNKPTQLQDAYLEEVRKRGGIALVAYSLDDVINASDLAEKFAAA